MINDPANLHSVKQRAAALSILNLHTPPSEGGEKEAAPISSQRWGLQLMGFQVDTAPPPPSKFSLTCLRPITALEPQGYNLGVLVCKNHSHSAQGASFFFFSDFLSFLAPLWGENGVSVSLGSRRLYIWGCHSTQLDPPPTSSAPDGLKLFSMPVTLEFQHPAMASSRWCPTTVNLCGAPEGRSQAGLGSPCRWWCPRR